MVFVVAVQTQPGDARRVVCRPCRFDLAESREWLCYVAGFASRRQATAFAARVARSPEADRAARHPSPLRRILQRVRAVERGSPGRCFVYF